MLVLLLLGLLARISMAMVSAETTDSVCDFAIDNMYVPDANQTTFPVGFLACRDEKNATIRRCQDCDCRQLQSTQNGGNIITWGVCVEGTNETTCETPQTTPPRTLCNVYVLASNQPTTVPSPAPLSAGSSHNGPKSTPAPAESMSSAKKTVSTLVTVILCSIGVAIIVVAYALCWTGPKKSPPETRSAPAAQTGYKAGEGRLTIAIPRYNPVRSHSMRSSEYIPPAPGQLAAYYPQTGDRVSHLSFMDSQRIGDFIVDSHRSADTRVLGDFLGDSQRSFAYNDGEMDSSRSMSVDIERAKHTHDDWDVSNRSQFTVAEEEVDDTLDHTGTAAFAGHYWRESAELETNTSAISFMEEVTPHEPVKVKRYA